MTTRQSSDAPAETVTISSRFNGPPGSANGGYTSGTTAQVLTGGPVTEVPVKVTLRRPPPVDRPLRVERQPDGVALYDGDALVCEARPTELELDLPTPVSPEQATRAAGLFDTAAYTERHPFPGCFTCGPGRDVGDGLRIFPAPTGDDRQMVAWPWTPDASLATEDGGQLVDFPVVWAALDCPSGLARFAGGSPVDDSQVSSVLGQMTAVVHRRPAPGETVVASGWAISDKGRKLLSGSALWSKTGETLAASQTVWIVLTEEQRAAFNVVDRP